MTKQQYHRLAKCRELAAFRVEGEILDGRVEYRVVTCPFQGDNIDIRGGVPLGEPAVKSIKTYPIFIIDGLMAIERENLPVQDIQTVSIIA